MGGLNLNFTDAENKLTVPDEGIEVEFSFIENELSFRDAYLQTLQSIRKNTDKDIVVLFSGGADSQLAEWGFNYLGIKHRVVHQRYLYDGAYLNWEEASFGMPEETEYQNIDVLEFQKSSVMQDIFVKEFPMSVAAAIQCSVKGNPETDFLISCASPYKTYSWNFEQRPRPDLLAKCHKWLFIPANMWKIFGYGRQDFEFAGVFYDNGYVTYSLIDDLYKQLARGLASEDSSYYPTRNWEVECKTAFLQHHFPEVDVKLFPKKYTNDKFPYFSKLVLDRVAGLYQYEIDNEMYSLS